MAKTSAYYFAVFMLVMMLLSSFILVFQYFGRNPDMGTAVATPTPNAVEFNGSAMFDGQIIAYADQFLVDCTANPPYPTTALTQVPGVGAFYKSSDKIGVATLNASLLNSTNRTADDVLFDALYNLSTYCTPTLLRAALVDINGSALTFKSDNGSTEIVSKRALTQAFASYYAGVGVPAYIPYGFGENESIKLSAYAALEDGRPTSFLAQGISIPSSSIAFATAHGRVASLANESRIYKTVAFADRTRNWTLVAEQLKSAPSLNVTDSRYDQVDDVEITMKDNESAATLAAVLGNESFAESAKASQDVVTLKVRANYSDAAALANRLAALGASNYSLPNSTLVVAATFKDAAAAEADASTGLGAGTDFRRLALVELTDRRAVADAQRVILPSSMTVAMKRGSRPGDDVALRIIAITQAGLAVQAQAEQTE